MQFDNDTVATTASDPTGSARAGVPRPRLIKRYANRKYYDTLVSHYVNLQDIAEMIRGGVEVRIVENESLRDLTSITLEHVVSVEAKRGSELSARSLSDLIRQGWARSRATEGDLEAPEVGPPAARRRADALLSQAEREAHGVRQMLRSAETSLSCLPSGLEERIEVEGASEVAIGFERLKSELARLSRRADHLRERLRELELAARRRPPEEEGAG